MSDTCPFCKSASTNTSTAIYCSNPRCLDALLNVLVESKKGLVGNTSDNPIIIYCPSCKAAAEAAAPLTTVAYCYPCNKWFDYTYEINKWYSSDSTNWKETYIRQYIGAPEYWDVKNVKLIDKTMI